MTSARRTLAQPAQFSGVGLHSGEETTARLLPAETGAGITVQRTDQPDAPRVRATAEHVSSTDRHTVLGEGEHAVRTVEHVLAAVMARAIDDVHIEVGGPELPAGDGSAAAAFAAIGEAGIVEQEGHPTALRLAAPLTVTEGDAHYVLAPATALRLTVSIESAHPVIGRQAGCYDTDASAFEAELAGARTYGFAADHDELLARGLARGASPDNTIVLSAEGLQSGELRWPDEFVRHKAVDLLGDLALAGGRVAADVVAFRPNHTGNVALARALRRLTQPSGPPIMGIEDILGAIPHRYPMLLVDRIIEVHGRERIVGLKNVTINEPFFQGHFPNHPIMPGVLIVEAMAQVGGMLLMGTVDDPENKVVYFMSIDNVKFRRPVVPGDQLRFELEMLQMRGRTCRMRGVGYVEGKPAAEAEMMARIMDR